MTLSPAAAPASLPDDDDILREILLRLPPQPSSLPRASFVCKRWRRLATDPQFRRRFRDHHRKPPLLGVFEQRKKVVFSSILEPPDRIPPERFSLRPDDDCSRGGELLGCRHGRVLVRTRRGEFVVFDPITGERRCLDVPPEFKRFYVSGTVFCAAGDQGHVHGGCHSSRYKVVLVSMYRDDHQPIVCVYSSETGVWGNIVSTAVPRVIFDAGGLGTLVDNSLYWITSHGVLVFDLDRQSLDVINGPPITHRCSRRIIQAEGGGVGLAVLSYPMFEMWQRKVSCHGVATWVLRKTVEMHNILGLPSRIEGEMRGMETILGYAEDTNVVFLYAGSSVYMVRLDSMQARRLYETTYMTTYHPFMSFYTPAIAGGYDGADIINDK